MSAWKGNKLEKDGGVCTGKEKGNGTRKEYAEKGKLKKGGQRRSFLPASEREGKHGKVVREMVKRRLEIRQSFGRQKDDTKQFIIVMSISMCLYYLHSCPSNCNDTQILGQHVANNVY